MRHNGIMADSTQEKATTAMIAMNAAIQRIRLFPISNPSTVDYINRAFEALCQLFKDKIPFTVEKTDQGVRVCGHPLEEKLLRKAQVSAFLDLLSEWNAGGLVLDHRLEQKAFAAFLELAAEKPESLKSQGGFAAAVAAAGLDRVIVDGGPAENLQGPREDALDIDPMLSTLEVITMGAADEDIEAICRHLGRVVVSRDDNTVCEFLSRKMEGNCRNILLGFILDELDDDRYKRLLTNIRQIRNALGAKRRLSAHEKGAASLDAAWDNLTRPARGKQLLESMNRAASNRIKSSMESLLKGDKTVFHDQDFLRSLPGVISRFMSKGNWKTLEAVIGRLSEALLSEGPEVRSETAPILSWTMGRLMADPACEAAMLKLSYKLAGWIRAETRMSRTYKTVCAQLGDVALRMIQNNKFDSCRHILTIFNFIHAGRIQKNDDMKAAARKTLEDIATPKLTLALMDDLNAGDEPTRKQAMDRLVLLGAGALDAMLDRLADSSSRKERSRLIRAIYLMGKTALPNIKDALQREAPWYYVRNLVLLFGKVGDETHLPIIAPFLEHDDLRVRKEALNSIYNIGGQEGRRSVLAALSQADDALKLNIIGLLGAWREVEAVYPLMKLLESDALAGSKLKNELAERICNALAAIGAPEAVPLLLEIAEDRKKGVFAGGKGFDDAVRTAAKAAIDAIEQKKAK